MKIYYLLIFIWITWRNATFSDNVNPCNPILISVASLWFRSVLLFENRRITVDGDECRVPENIFQVLGSINDNNACIHEITYRLQTKAAINRIQGYVCGLRTVNLDSLCVTNETQVVVT